MEPTFHDVIEVTSLNNPSDGLALTDTHLYIGEGWGGVKIIDIHNNNNVLSHILLNGDSDSIELTNDG